MKTLSLIRIPKDQLLPGGAYREFAETQVLFGHIPKEAGANMEYLADLKNQVPTFDDLKDMVQAGVYFENIPLGIELTAAGAQRNVPDVIPGATYIDPDSLPDNPIILNRTWAQWVRTQVGMTAYKKVDENLYIIKAFVNSQMMNSDMLKVAHVQLGVNVIEWSVHQFRVRSEEWEEFEL